MRKKQCLAAAAAVTLLLTAVPAFARSPRAIDDNDRVPLRGNVHPNARAEFDAGPAEPTLPMERMILTLKLAPEKHQQLNQLLAEQHDPASPNYQHWLTPEEFADRFAPDPEDIAAIKGWLTSQGFTIDEVSRGRTSINFTGDVAKVEKAFRTKIRKYQVDGKIRHANAQDPEIPRGLADVVAGVATLHDFGHKPMNTGARLLADVQPEYTYSSSIHWMSPIDFAAIYNLNPLYSAGYDGTGQSIAIVGRTHPTGNNWNDFRSIMGLPAKAVTVIVNGTDPGSVSTGEDNEADLDVEWAGAVAKNATIQFVISKTTVTTDGVDLSAKYIVDNNLAPVMSTSFGLCEASMGTAQNNFYNNLWQQAAAQGITSVVAAGDSGAAGCDSASATTGTGLGINGLASTPYNVAVGGTTLNDQGGGYWRSTNGPYYDSAIGYIPESAWNESGLVSGGYQLWATGSGLSSVYAKPSWQVAPGVPASSMRGIPDVSLTASAHVPYLVRSKNALYMMSGTSASSPAFAGIMALIVQKTGVRQGNANIKLYQMGNAQYTSTGPVVFHDSTAGSSSVPGVTGYSCTSGYDLVTGLGSVNANALVTNWPTAAPLAISAGTLANGTQGVAYSATLSASGGSAPYTWSLATGSLAGGMTLSSGGVLSGTPTTTGVFGFTVQLSDTMGTTVTKAFSHAVSATACSNQPVQISGATPVLYPDFSSAYLAATTGADLQLQALDFTSDFVFDRDVIVSLSGGNDCAYADSSNKTGLLGKLRVSKGTVAIDKLAFK
ncbi:protease pro-enzyme activation domain-containing protein [Geomonas subterranea]|uniref:S8 family serine peptidase n=1 Tax=Geomonas subterranea TaxID=2847989 RepID=A0ABX8LJ22_9BACT|nr:MULTISPECIES: protease pro-enzyme activation domain-containing protein [Geomonas]QXE90901.1 S8 family serine peptidase [Geomonas subterranea]QXM11014.1 S8 family serine peptidase [Geomonas subterranea]